MVQTNIVNSHLKVKNGRFHMVVGYKDIDGKWQQKWKSTGLVIRGNKKRAESMLKEYAEQIEKALQNTSSFQNKSKDNGSKTNGLSLITFADFILLWLEQHRKNIRSSTYLSYHTIINNQIFPYFQAQGTLLIDINQNDIADYYDFLYQKGNKPNSVKKHHANIRKSLDFAYKRDIIPNNPADKVELMKVDKYVAEYYSNEELNELFDKLKADNHWLEDIVLVASFYGFRRSEVLGLRWECVDFDNRTISIEHTVTMGLDEDGKRYLDLSDKTKTEASKRELPLVDVVKELLLERKKYQNLHRKVCGKSYSKEYLDYIFVDELGDIIRPNRVTSNFMRYLKVQKLKPIRFHDLRHAYVKPKLKKLLNY